MDQLWTDLQSTESEETVSKFLAKFVDENQSNFQVSGPANVKRDVCRCLLENITPGPSNETAWSPKTQLLALTVLRILARGKDENPLCSEDSLKALVSLANSPDKLRNGLTEDETKVMVESVKCLCNLFLNHKELISKSSELGILNWMEDRLNLHYIQPLSYEMVYFDLRLLFLITACDVSQRLLFEEKHRGIQTVTNVISRTLNCCPATPTSSEATPISSASSREGTMLLSHTLTEQDMTILCEALKIIFNQTFDWKDKEELLPTMNELGSLIRLLLVSVPAQLNQETLQLITHVVEVLVNFPHSSMHTLLLPQEQTVTPFLTQTYPKLYTKTSPTKSIIEGGVASGVGVVYTLDIDRVYEGWNFASVLALLNVLHMRLSGEPGRHAIPTLLTALRNISQGNRCIRRFLRAEILPPLRNVTQRPDEGESLKSKIVRLMTAASPHGAEEVSAEFLFVLCKENANRLVKYTGYGRAAGLLMAHGLLSGGTSPGQSQYSDDEEDSDTEEYQESKVDVMTGGPAAEKADPLEGMTDEQKEEEAKKLHDLIQRLNEKGIIQMAPLGSDNQPIKFPSPPPPPDDSETDNTD